MEPFLRALFFPPDFPPEFLCPPDNPKNSKAGQPFLGSFGSPAVFPFGRKTR
jgi:hypothetical protein